MKTYVWALVVTVCITASVTAVHEVGHLIAVEHLVADSSINFGVTRHMGVAFITGSVRMPDAYYTNMDLFLIGLAGPLWGFLLSFIIFWTTKDAITAIVCSFFMFYQGVYCITEPLKSLGMLDTFTSLLIPITAAIIWIMWYASDVKRSMS